MILKPVVRAVVGALEADKVVQRLRLRRLSLALLRLQRGRDSLLIACISLLVRVVEVSAHLRWPRPVRSQVHVRARCHRVLVDVTRADEVI